MTEFADGWQAFCDAFNTFARHIDLASTININSNALRSETKVIAQKYFRDVRSMLGDLALNTHQDVLDAAFQILIQLSSSPNAATSYKKQIKVVRKALPKIAGQIELNQHVIKQIASTQEDQRLFETLEGLLPTAALSYKQAVLDLADNNRVSFRGPALELREALRETLDHLAPDETVTNAEGYVLEKGRHGPTMKQKVRFILKARGRGRSLSTVPEQTTSTIDELIGTLTRSVYEMSSVATHVSVERRTVDQIRRYVFAVLHDILEL